MLMLATTFFSPWHGRLPQREPELGIYEFNESDHHWMPFNDGSQVSMTFCDPSRVAPWHNERWRVWCFSFRSTTWPLQRWRSCLLELFSCGMYTSNILWGSHKCCRRHVMKWDYWRRMCKQRSRDITQKSQDVAGCVIGATFQRAVRSECLVQNFWISAGTRELEGVTA
jgi:hypothetical protein